MQPAVLAARNWILIGLSLTIPSGTTAKLAFFGGAPAAAMVGIAIAGATVRERRLLTLPNHPLVEAYGLDIKHLQAHSWWLNGRPRPF